MKNISLKNNTALIAVTIATSLIAARFIPHPVNCTPIGALSLFTGTLFSPLWALLLIISTLFIGDCFCGFHSTIPFVYGSFVITIFFGYLLKTRWSFFKTICASVGSSLIFFFLSNFGVWLTSGWYPHTFQGLILTFFYALPFYQNSSAQIGSLLGATICSDLFFTLLIFGSYFGIFAPKHDDCASFPREEESLKNAK